MLGVYAREEMKERGRGKIFYGYVVEKEREREGGRQHQI